MITWLIYSQDKTTKGQKDHLAPNFFEQNFIPENTPFWADKVQISL